ncbi:outer membrane lipid asymmetry maintenance protein MlaD [Candidatus Ichthyocystis hellenicum]|uniref:outer membrane lipid asymmetry maintenance protein MlaD n=1 Tax=Candidatus Ichthyocystis hellenicum TaxID=1561003 RepID=UPI000B85B362|nr:outer membrane lipid asymmetry maintenance protein MlaD [Candidatus Ichthyocystis hellenicum]
MEYRRYDLTVGFFFLLAFVGFFFISAMATRGVSFWEREKYYEVTAVFQNVGQLSVGSPVKSSGVLVGRVVNIDLDPKTYQAVVRMHISDFYHFPVDSTASILTTGLLGVQFIGLEAGLDASFLKNGDRIFHTQSAWFLEKVLSQFLVNHLNK